MAKNELETVANRSEDEGPAASARGLSVARWGVLLIAYLFLLLGTGYIAFFQPAYNPALEIDDQISALINDENTRQFTLESLKEEGTSFAARRDLAVQSFNVTLGAALGFLSAAAAQSIRRREDT